MESSRDQSENTGNPSLIKTRRNVLRKLGVSSLSNVLNRSVIFSLVEFQSQPYAWSLNSHVMHNFIPNSPTNMLPRPLLFHSDHLIPGRTRFDEMLPVEGKSLGVKAWVTVRL